MPLIKRGGTNPPSAGDKPANDSLATLVQALTAPDPDVRWRAARELGGRVEAVPALAAALKDEQAPRIREALMTALMRVGNAASVDALLPYLRSQDAAVRTSAIEALQALPEIIGSFMPHLLEDSDSDVRILAVELARNLPAEEATQILCTLVEQEAHPNVCAAAIEVLTEVGTIAALPALQSCARRFSATPFLPFAASVAIARISGAKN